MLSMVSNITIVRVMYEKEPRPQAEHSVETM